MSASQDPTSLDFWVDPDWADDPLPQPFQLIDKILTSCVRDAVEIASGDAKTMQHKNEEYNPPQANPSIHFLEEPFQNHILCYSLVEDGLVILVTTKGELILYNCIQQRVMAHDPLPSYLTDASFQATTIATCAHATIGGEIGYIAVSMTRRADPSPNANPAVTAGKAPSRPGTQTGARSANTSAAPGVGAHVASVVVVYSIPLASSAGESYQAHFLPLAELRSARPAPPPAEGAAASTPAPAPTTAGTTGGAAGPSATAEIEVTGYVAALGISIPHPAPPPDSPSHPPPPTGLLSVSTLPDLAGMAGGATGALHLLVFAAIPGDLPPKLAQGAGSRGPSPVPPGARGSTPAVRKTQFSKHLRAAPFPIPEESNQPSTDLAMSAFFQRPPAQSQPIRAFVSCLLSLSAPPRSSPSSFPPSALAPSLLQCVQRTQARETARFREQVRREEQRRARHAVREEVRRAAREEARLRAEQAGEEGEDEARAAEAAEEGEEGEEEDDQADQDEEEEEEEEESLWQIGWYGIPSASLLFCNFGSGGNAQNDPVPPTPMSAFSQQTKTLGRPPPSVATMSVAGAAGGAGARSSGAHHAGLGAITQLALDPDGGWGPSGLYEGDRRVAAGVMVRWNGTGVLARYSMRSLLEHPACLDPAPDAVWNLPSTVTAWATGDRGRLACAGFADGSAVLWDAVSSSEVMVLPAAKSPVTAIAVNGARPIVRVSIASRDGTLRLFDLAARRTAPEQDSTMPATIPPPVAHAPPHNARNPNAIHLDVQRALTPVTTQSRARYKWPISIVNSALTRQGRWGNLGAEHRTQRLQWHQCFASAAQGEENASARSACGKPRKSGAELRPPVPVHMTFGAGGKTLLVQDALRQVRLYHINMDGATGYHIGDRSYDSQSVSTSHRSYMYGGDYSSHFPDTPCSPGSPGSPLGMFPPSPHPDPPAVSDSTPEPIRLLAKLQPSDTRSLVAAFESYAVQLMPDADSPHAPASPNPVRPAVRGLVQAAMRSALDAALAQAATSLSPTGAALSSAVTTAREAPESADSEEPSASALVETLRVPCVAGEVDPALFLAPPCGAISVFAMEDILRYHGNTKSTLPIFSSPSWNSATGASLNRMAPRPLVSPDRHDLPSMHPSPAPSGPPQTATAPRGIQHRMAAVLHRRMASKPQREARTLRRFDQLRDEICRLEHPDQPDPYPCGAGGLGPGGPASSARRTRTVPRGAARILRR